MNTRNDSDSSKYRSNHNDDSGDNDNMIMPVSVKLVSLSC
jgi:hypothetical protein